MAVFPKQRKARRFELAAKTSRKIAAFWGLDDWGYRDGLMISPTMMRRRVFPVHKRMAEVAHSRGSLCILHSCVDLGAMMDDIIDYVGVDAKHSSEDAYPPVTEAKEASTFISLARSYCVKERFQHGKFRDPSHEASCGHSPDSGHSRAPHSGEGTHCEET